MSPGHLSLLDGQGSFIIYLCITPCVSLPELESTFGLWLMIKGSEWMGTHANDIITALPAMPVMTSKPSHFCSAPWPGLVAGL